MKRNRVWEGPPRPTEEETGGVYRRLGHKRRKRDRSVIGLVLKETRSGKAFQDPGWQGRLGWLGWLGDALIRKSR